MIYALGDVATAAIITGAFAVVMLAVQVVVDVRRSLKRDVGRANGAGTLVEMVERTVEQVGVVRAQLVTNRAELMEHQSDERAELAAAKADLEEHRADLEEHRAEVKADLEARHDLLNRRLDRLSGDLTKHLDDHALGAVTVAGVLTLESHNVEPTTEPEGLNP